MALCQWAFISLLCVSLVNSLYRRALIVFGRRKFIHRNNCQPPNRYRHKEPILGLDLSLDTYQNLKDGNYLEGYREHFKTQGNTFEAKVLGAKAIFTIEPENIRTVLSTKFEDFDYDTQRRNAWASVLGHSIFTTERFGWSESRRLLRPIFAKSQINNLELIERHVQNLLDEIHRGDPVVDLQRLFYRLTFEIATDLFFGDPDVSSLSEKSLSHLTDAFGHALEVMGRRHVLGNGLDALIPDANFKNDHEDILQVIDRYVDKALQTKQDSDSDNGSVKSDDSKSTGSESRYVFCEEIASATTDSDRIRGELLSLLFAGRDTTAILLGNLSFVLARNTLMWKRLQLEISHLGGTPPTLEQLKAFTYLRNCLHESLRVHPPVPINSRMSLRDTTLPKGGGPDGDSPVFVPAGTMVNYHIHAVHLREDLWGSEAGAFNPDRWEESPPAWGYLPFSGGPKVCLGQELALNEASYTMVRLLQEFESISSEDAGDWQESIALFCSSKNGVKVSLQSKAQTLSPPKPKSRANCTYDSVSKSGGTPYK